jgi:hypothetical protein
MYITTQTQYKGAQDYWKSILVTSSNKKTELSFLI